MLFDRSISQHKIIKYGVWLHLAFNIINTRVYAGLPYHVLPSHVYGSKFKVYLKGGLSRELAYLYPEIGDGIAFFNPLLFYNPEFKSENDVKYLLTLRKAGATLMWFSKQHTEEMRGKSEDNHDARNVTTSENREKRVSSSSKLIRVEKNNDETQGQNVPQASSIGETSSKARQIQLPVKPQIPANVKILNPQYTYKTISEIQTDGSQIKEQKVNFFGVVSEICKGVSTTSSGKYHLMCNLVDDSGENGTIRFHIFNSEDTIVKQIEARDILRVHRARLEKYKDIIDGRVFFAQDLVLFKKGFANVKPITVAQKTHITDDQKKRVETLRKWFEEQDQSPVLGDVDKAGTYHIFCKLVREPIKVEDKIRLTVTDGSAIKTLVPAIPLVRYKLKERVLDHLVTEITVFNNLNEYTHLKVDDFVLFSEVEAVPFGPTKDKFRLEIRSNSIPEILLDKSLRVLDIESRIEQFLQSVKANKPNNIDTGESDNQNSVQMRQQKNKQMMSPEKNNVKSGPSFCDNKSCTKPKATLLNTKDDCDTRNSESDPGTKSRKQLFTPNYMTDLSDAATDETSELNAEVSKRLANQVPHEDVVNPANTNFNDIVEKVKTKYCTPKNMNSPRDDDDDTGRRCSRKKNEENTKHSESRLDSSRKRSAEVTNQEDLDDVETVVNDSFYTSAVDISSKEKKRPRLASVSTDDGIQRNDDTDNCEFDKRSSKVTSWLFHPRNKISSAQEDLEDVETRLHVIRELLVKNDGIEEDQSSLLSSRSFRTNAFLLSVNPDPLSNPLDLVSGYCHSGCQQVYMFSSLNFNEDENIYIPLCPSCIQLEQEKEVKLMFMIELIVMDQNGRHFSVVALKHQAEKFLNCSVEEFVRDPGVRESRVRLLTDNMVHNSRSPQYSPLLDMGVTVQGSKGDTFFLVNCNLRLPRL